MAAAILCDGFGRWTRVLVLLALLPSFAQADEPRTYSDVREIEESGDVVGTELTLQVSGESATGTLRHYEGTEPEPIQVAGRLVGDELTLDGSYSQGRVTIRARLRGDHIVGTLNFQLDQQTNTVELNLPRVARPRMHKAATPEAHVLPQHPPRSLATLGMTGGYRHRAVADGAPARNCSASHCNYSSSSSVASNRCAKLRTVRIDTRVGSTR